MKTTMCVLAVMMTAMLCSCSDRDEWEPMEWSGLSNYDHRTVNVKAEGGDYEVTCTNYDEIRYGAAMETTGSEQKVYTYATDSIGNPDTHNMVTDWAVINVRGRKLKVSMKANPTARERILTVSATSGDAYDNINFVQAGK